MTTSNPFTNKEILVIGDIMLDKYIEGDVERISPEAPVPIISVTNERYVPGGAANAAANVASLGGEARLMGITGDDMARSVLIDETKRRGIDTTLVKMDSSKPTIQKIRVVAQSQQLLRIDYEDTTYCDHLEARDLGAPHAILISDYAKGAISKKLMHDIAEWCHKSKTPLIIDPKPKHKAWYKGCTLITPNRKEAMEMTGIAIHTEEDAEIAARAIQEELGCHVLLTLGEKGMCLLEIGKKAIHLPTRAQEVYDVSGAGDTVIATMALCMASSYGLESAAQLANKAAGIKVSKIGTAPVSYEEIA